ncbi:splicing factor 3B subunit 2-like isoform X2 [Dendronephthya gigantea]|uniref:splicing factor 3B subunit 2-like isoform X2 n=1 Tax=Dendronephthya gigantea TaxID=151771 RepID=UPI00106BC71A|nr:splicing factor 3B subunit 2-like isoform X2 [Dendronephthya gigantea]
MADQYEFQNLTFAEIKKLKVADLKARLSSLGLPVSGLKADLVARLASFLESRALQAKLQAKDEESTEVDDGGSVDQGEQSGVTGVVKIEGDKQTAQNIATDIAPGQISTIASHAVGQEALEKKVGDVPIIGTEALVEPAVKTSENIIDVDSQMQQAVMQVDVTGKDDAEGNDETKAEEIQQEVKAAEIPEEIGVEVEADKDVYAQADEEGIEAKPDESKEELGAKQIDFKEIEEGNQELVLEAQIPCETSAIFKPEIEIMADQEEHKASRESDIGANNQTEDAFKAQQFQSVVSALDDHEPDQSDITSLHEGLTHPQEIRISVEEVGTKNTEENVSHHSIQSGLQSGWMIKEPVTSAPEDVEQALSPSSEFSKELPSLEQPLPTLPPHEEPSQLHLPSHLAHDPSAHETELSKEPTPQGRVPQDKTLVIDTPAIVNSQEDDTVDPLAEAKAKARSVVEMREKRLNEENQVGTREDDSGYDVDHYEQEGTPATESRQEKKKKKKKKRKKRTNEQPKVQDEALPDDEGVEVEYVAETLDFKDPVYAQFASIFETFKLSEKPEAAKKDESKDKTEDQTTDGSKKDDEDNDMDTDSEEEETQKKDEKPGEKVEKLSKKKLKLKNRMSVAELKQTVHRPDVVEMHDVTAPDPKLLVYLKACRNTVPVPRHWCFKRKFLQGKRGIIKPPFQLPEFIQKTGIMEMREALQEKEDAKNMKAKMREKIRPKMGKIDIDYQKLHDAFFKWQTKPKMSIHGDLYYEGKEFETKLKEKKPGDLSEDLRTALGMPTGQGSNLVPPPWLIAMQRYGPPPSYPNLKIPGLNAPIPEGASFGYHAGGWGKPPVDEHGRPLYGDVFGVQQTDANIIDDEQIDSNLWGELESESEESEESEEESEEEAPDQSGLVTPAETGLVTPSGLTSIPAGMETPDMIELRKRKNIEDSMESGSEQPTLFTVLPEKRAGVGGMMMGTSHVYDLASAAVPTGARKAPGGLSEGVEVALDPSELELDPAAMQARYDEQLREQQNTQKEDFSDMVAEHAARQQKKRKKTTESGKAAKKYKEFKF